MDNPNALIGKTSEPTSEELAAVLGPTSSLWNQLVGSLAVDLGNPVQEWNSVNPQKYGWSFILKVKKRRIVYLSPCAGHFRVSFVLSDKAMAAARSSKLPKSIVKILEEAPHYPEGTGVRLTVKNAKIMPAIRSLAKIKLAS